MTHDTAIAELLAAAAQQAGDVASTRLGRPLEVGAATVPESASLLRFDLSFPGGSLLSWFVSNEDATGFADMLIGGAGDRTAVLTEMHLDALSNVFSDMLERAVEGISARLATPLEAGGVDMGMESSVPTQPAGGHHAVHALEIDGFGSVVIVQQVNAAMSELLAARLSPAGTSAASTPHASAAHLHAATGHPLVPGDGANVLPFTPQPLPTQHASDADLQMLMNVPLPLTVELGRTQRTIRDLVEMSVGSIIELSKLAGDPLEIKVNDRVIARGEVVVIDEEFGVRVTEIVAPEERLRRLG